MYYPSRGKFFRNKSLWLKIFLNTSFWELPFVIAVKSKIFYFVLHSVHTTEECIGSILNGTRIIQAAAPASQVLYIVHIYAFFANTGNLFSVMPLKHITNSSILLRWEKEIPRIIYEELFYSSKSSSLFNIATCWVTILIDRVQ